MDSITTLDPDEMAFLINAREQYRSKKESERRKAEYEAYARQKYASVQHVTLHIQPVLPCSWCERMTDIVQAEWSHSNGWQLSVNCFEHGLCEETPEAESTSIKRFIVGSHDGKGSAAVVGSCKPLDVPGFTLDEDEDEEGCVAWKCQYYPDEYGHMTVYVVWVYDDIQFYLYDEVI